MSLRSRQAPDSVNGSILGALLPPGVAMRACTSGPHMWDKQVQCMFLEGQPSTEAFRHPDAVTGTGWG